MAILRMYILNPRGSRTADPHRESVKIASVSKKSTARKSKHFEDSVNSWSLDPEEGTIPTVSYAKMAYFEWLIAPRDV